MSDERRGFLYGVAAHAVWGLFPLYWKLLERTGALELLAHRIVWSLVVVAIMAIATRRLGALRAILAEPRRRWPLVAAAVLIAVNWGAFIWGATHGRVVETSLGEFMCPLFTVLLGVVLLHERLRAGQWVAVGLGAVAVVVLSIENGRPPWIAITMTASFGFYGFFKKKASSGTIEGMAMETALMAPLALAMIVALGIRGEATVVDHGSGYLALVLLTGPLAALPLLLFGAAASRLRLSALGLLNYVAPLMQFAIGVGVFHEPMPPLRWAGFALVWLALLILALDGLSQRGSLVPVAAPATAA